MLTKDAYNKIKDWVYRHARPIEWARWRYLFEAADQGDVLKCLKAYQNRDGGFGNGLEADSLNPDSSPITTGHGIMILKEIGDISREDEMIKGLLRYIEQSYHSDLKRWDAVIQTNNDHPHAPWWTFGEGCNEGWGFNPTAIMLGFYLFYGDPTSSFYATAETLTQEIMTHFISGKLSDGTYYHAIKREGEIRCLNSLVEYLEEAGFEEQYPVEPLKACMKKQIHVAIEKDARKWSSYCSRPSEFIKGPDSYYLEGFENLMDEELNFLMDQRGVDNIWNITWQWADYPDAFAVSRNWWKAHLAIENVTLLKAFGRIEA